jgi:uncharacterized membrane protein YgcG
MDAFPQCSMSLVHRALDYICVRIMANFLLLAFPRFWFRLNRFLLVLRRFRLLGGFRIGWPAALLRALFDSLPIFRSWFPRFFCLLFRCLFLSRLRFLFLVLLGLRVWLRLRFWLSSRTSKLPTHPPLGAFHPHTTVFQDWSGRRMGGGGGGGGGGSWSSGGRNGQKTGCSASCCRLLLLRRRALVFPQVMGD